MIAYWLFSILSVACLVLIVLNQLGILSDRETGWFGLIIVSVLFLLVPAMLSAFFKRSNKELKNNDN